MKRVLIADDEAAMRFAVKRMMVLAGYEVIEACNGNEVIEMICEYEERGEVIDLLLLDVLMPGRPGPEVMDELCRMKKMIPVVVITGYIHLSSLERLKQYKDCPILKKPFRPEELLEAISKVLPESKDL